METGGFLYNEMVGIWVAAILTLAIYSFLYDDNVVYRIVEYLFVGVANGYLLVVTFYQSVKPNLLDKIFMDNNLWYIIPGILGLMMLGRLSPKHAWLSRWPMAIVVGIGSGLTINAAIQSDIMMQLSKTMIPVMGNDFITNLNNLILVLGVFTGLFYFFFSVEHKGIFKTASYIGIYYLMIAFGGAFGNTVMARISLLIGRMQFLIDKWLPLMLN